jgi:hypothetical protein
MRQDDITESARLDSNLGMPERPRCWFARASKRRGRRTGRPPDARGDLNLRSKGSKTRFEIYASSAGLLRSWAPDFVRD